MYSNGNPVRHSRPTPATRATASNAIDKLYISRGANIPSVKVLAPRCPLHRPYVCSQNNHSRYSRQRETRRCSAMPRCRSPSLCPAASNTDMPTSPPPASKRRGMTTDAPLSSNLSKNVSSFVIYHLFVRKSTKYLRFLSNFAHKIKEPLMIKALFLTSTEPWSASRPTKFPFPLSKR